MLLEILIPVLIIASIGAMLALLLVLAEKFIANYGECTITINDEKQFTVQGGDYLLRALANEEIFIPSACGGRGTCGFCKVKVLEGAGPLLPTEEPFLTPQQRDDNIRLSCQVKIREDLKIEIPKELLAVKQYTCLCEKITELTHDIRLFRFRLKQPETIDYIPGQYVQLMAPAYPGNKEEAYRAYSVASDPQDHSVIELIIRLVPGGICTTYCFEHLKEGDIVKINGPYGEFQLSDTQAPMIFIAGGSGMAPIRNFLFEMRNKNINRKVTYFFGANVEKELFMLDEMKQFEQDVPNYRFMPVVCNPQDDYQGEKGLVTEAVARQYKDASDHEAYLCGSPGMIDASIKVLIQLGIPEDKIYYDKFA